MYFGQMNFGLNVFWPNEFWTKNFEPKMAALKGLFDKVHP
jgi:hypothetical protein